MKNLRRAELLRHWLLEIAVEFPRELSLIFPRVEGQALNVKEIPGLEQRDYVDALTQLFDERKIEFCSEETGEDISSATDVESVLRRFLQLSIDDSLLRHHGQLTRPFERHGIRQLQVRFKLTVEGGEQWERMASPNWMDFFAESRDRQQGELKTQNLNLLVARMGWFSELNGERIRLESISVQLHPKYQVLYWKQLSNVYAASFSIEPAAANWPGQFKEPDWFREWRFRTESWHKRPWDLPGWPVV